METQRKKWVDGARALAILLVMFGHFNPGMGMFFVITSPVKIPLFFMISGYLFVSNRYRHLGAFLAERIRRMLLPYVLLSCLITVPFDVLLNLSEPNAIGMSILGSLLRVVRGETLWFIPCLFLTELLAYGIHFLTEKYLTARCRCAHLLILAGASCISLVLMFVFCGKGPLYWHPETAVMMLPFFQLGYCYRRYEQDIDRLNRWLKIGVSVSMYALFIYLNIIVNGTICVDINMNHYLMPPLTFFSIACGGLMVFEVFKVLSLPSFYVWIGQNTFALYALHDRVHSVVKLGLKMIHLDISAFGYWGSLPFLVLVVVASVLPIWLINRYCPWLVGKRKR